MFRKLHLIIILFALLPTVKAQQDTLTVMQYNLLYYGNYNSGYADCYETNNNTQRKDECIRTIVGHVRPDIFTVCEFGSRDDLQSDFLRHNLNIDGKTYWQSDKLYYSSGSNICNTIFFDSRKIGLKRHVTLNTSPRLTDVYELYLKTKSLATGDTIKLVCIVAHPKAGQGYEASRRTLMQTAMDYVNQNYSTDNVLIMGDFNMYSADESGYKLLTQTYSNPYARFIDPVASIGGVGEWNNNSQYAAFHTQSTHSYSDECFSSGGLDDRFDFILMSDEIAFSYNHMRYVQGSYHAVGNDGRHFNQSIDQGTNTAVPSDVAEALFDASDHLPVSMKIAVDAKLGVDDFDLPQYYASIAPNPALSFANIHFQNPTEGLIRFDVISLQGQRIITESAYFGQGLQNHTIDLNELASGFYLLRISNETRTLSTLKLMKK